MSGRKRASQSGGVEVEFRPDGWERFRIAVAAAAKSGPKHRQSKHKPKELEAKKPNKCGGHF
jgi:hypothetical protein